jgi:cytochrome c5
LIIDPATEKGIGGSMRSNRVVSGLVILLVVAVSLLSACGGDAPDQAEPGSTGGAVSISGEGLLEDRCTECHALERTTSASKSRDQWDQTVTRMIGHGAELSDEEQAALVDYLVENYGP